MNKIQIRISKFLTAFLILSIFASHLANSQGISSRLSQADSLFGERKYTESLDIYESITAEDRKASPAMLLRMAYIYEGLGRTSQALISLDNYYRLTSDKKVLTKMTELADQNNLEGYKTSDLDYILNFYDKFRYLFVLGILAFALLILSMMYRKRKKHKESSPGLGLGLLATLALIFY